MILLWFLPLVLRFPGGHDQQQQQSCTAYLARRSNYLHQKVQSQTLPLQWVATSLENVFVVVPWLAHSFSEQYRSNNAPSTCKDKQLQHYNIIITSNCRSRPSIDKEAVHGQDSSGRFGPRGPRVHSRGARPCAPILEYKIRPPRLPGPVDQRLSITCVTMPCP